MCAFCDVVADPSLVHLVYEDATTIAFLDHRPLFKGHSLVVPKGHVETLGDLPRDRVGPYFEVVQLLGAAVQEAMGAHGSFIALNNKVSQSVPHLHVHVVPRNKKDGLRGFFWPRTRYESESDAAGVAASIRRAVAEVS
ncbi:MAG: histidine triad family protein [Actinomycetota bacterium]|nr:histidine triad family protein [Actinomycetota bacterium]